MGVRDDVRKVPKAQRKALLDVITLIDVYDLHGQAAYPKQHAPSDIADLYRLAAARRGVFVNPALTEPFGLTLLEAAACGLPIVATNNGGPRDIVANCQNGLLVDPFDQHDIERALLQVLTERDKWDLFSQNGLQGAHEHYSWKRHVKRYMRDVIELVERAATSARETGRKTRRLPQFDRLIITDIDNTLTGDEAALREFVTLLNEHHDRIGFGVSTGRKLDSAVQMLKQLGLPRPDVLDTSVGTELHYGDKLTPDLSWRKQIGFQWDPEGVHRVLDGVPGLKLQPAENQSDFKISYEIDPGVAPSVGKIRKLLREAGLRVKVVLSLEAFLDVIPVRGGSGMSIRHLAIKWGFSPEQLLIAGDSGNDEGMLRGRMLGVVVGNYSPELKKLRKRPRIYFAKGEHARGILEGIQYYNFLDHVTIPNDET
jgi:sucrose-phosphate synthase